MSVLLGLRTTLPIDLLLDRVLKQNWQFLARGAPSFPSDLLDFQSLKIPLKVWDHKTKLLASTSQVMIPVIMKQQWPPPNEHKNLKTCSARSYQEAIFAITLRLLNGCFLSLTPMKRSMDPKKQQLKESFFSERWDHSNQKWMVGRPSFPFEARPIFSGAKVLVSGRADQKKHPSQNRILMCCFENLTLHLVFLFDTVDGSEVPNNHL